MRNLLGSLSGYALMVQFSAASENFILRVLNNTAPVGSFTLPSGPHLPSYNGGAFAYTLTADLDSVRLTSTLDSFDSGDLLFSSAGIVGFDSLDDLGSSFSLLLGTESGGNPADGTPAAIAYDYVEIVGTSAVPEPSRLLLVMAGLAGVALRRRKR